jgi:hypothetical protein
MGLPKSWQFFYATILNYEADTDPRVTDPQRGGVQPLLVDISGRSFTLCSVWVHIRHT